LASAKRLIVHYFFSLISDNGSLFCDEVYSKEKLNRTIAILKMIDYFCG